MILKTLEAMGVLHRYGIARRIEQTSGGALAVPYGAIDPALVKLEQRHRDRTVHILARFFANPEKEPA